MYCDYSEVKLDSQLVLGQPKKNAHDSPFVPITGPFGKFKNCFAYKLCSDVGENKAAKQASKRCVASFGITEPFDQKAGGEGKKKSAFLLHETEGKKTFNHSVCDPNVIVWHSMADNYIKGLACEHFATWFPNAPQAYKTSKDQINNGYTPLLNPNSDRGGVPYMRTDCNIINSKAPDLALKVFVPGTVPGTAQVGSYKDVQRGCEEVPVVQWLSIWYMKSTGKWGIKCITSHVMVYPQSAASNDPYSSQPAQSALPVTTTAPVPMQQ